MAPACTAGMQMKTLVLCSLIAPLNSLHVPVARLSENIRSVAAQGVWHAIFDNEGVRRACSTRTSSRSAITPHMSAAAPREPLEPDDEPDPTESSSPYPTPSRSGGTADAFDMSDLARRISSVQEHDELLDRLKALPQAYVLVYNEDTDDETVYSMEVAAEGGVPVVLAFECDEEAAQYAASLAESDEVLEDEEASVQALDVEALIVTSRDAEIRVAIVFKGDLEMAGPDASADVTPLLITTSGRLPQSSSPVRVTITMVPEDMYEDKTSADFLDPSEDPVWVLIHDEGTADAQFFSMELNGTASVVCFKDEAAAARCSLALETKEEGRTGPSTRSLLLGDLLETLGDEEIDVCLVDEVVETLLDDDTQPGVVASDSTDKVLGSVGGSNTEAGDSSASSASVRAMLKRCFSANGVRDEDGGDWLDDRPSPG